MSKPLEDKRFRSSISGSKGTRKVWAVGREDIYCGDPVSVSVSVHTTGVDEHTKSLRQAVKITLWETRCFTFSRGWSFVTGTRSGLWLRGPKTPREECRLGPVPEEVSVTPVYRVVSRTSFRCRVALGRRVREIVHLGEYDWTIGFVVGCGHDCVVR